MFAACCARTFAVATRRSVFLAGVIACLIAARAEAVTVVSVSGPSTTGWTFANTSGNSSLNGNFTSTVSTFSGTWWGLYANSGQTASQTYSFASALSAVTGTTVLRAGETVQIDLALGFNNAGTVGIGLQNSSGVNRFETYYIGGNASDTFKLNDAGGQENITGPNTSFTNSSWNNGNYQTILFTQLAGNQYSLSFDGTPVTNSGLTLAASDISQIRFFNFDAGSGSGNNQYANNLVVVPEPESLLMAAAGGFAAAARWLTRMGRGRRRATAVC